MMTKIREAHDGFKIIIDEQKTVMDNLQVEENRILKTIKGLDENLEVTLSSIIHQLPKGIQGLEILSQAGNKKPLRVYEEALEEHRRLYVRLGGDIHRNQERLTGISAKIEQDQKSVSRIQQKIASVIPEAVMPSQSRLEATDKIVDIANKVPASRPPGFFARFFNQDMRDIHLVSQVYPAIYQDSKDIDALRVNMPKLEATERSIAAELQESLSKFQHSFPNPSHPFAEENLSKTRHLYKAYNLAYRTSLGKEGALALRKAVGKDVMSNSVLLSIMRLSAIKDRLEQCSKFLEAIEGFNKKLLAGFKNLDRVVRTNGNDRIKLDLTQIWFSWNTLKNTTSTYLAKLEALHKLDSELSSLCVLNPKENKKVAQSADTNFYQDSSDILIWNTIYNNYIFNVNLHSLELPNLDTSISTNVPTIDDRSFSVPDISVNVPDIKIEVPDFHVDVPSYISTDYSSSSSYDSGYSSSDP